MDEATILEIHTHSTVSDGEYAPRKLAGLMIERGVDLWALTDHDAVDGCEEASRAVEGTDVAFVSGIEISAERDDTSIHVLGYGFDPDDPVLQRYGEQMVDARRERMAEMVDRMCELGVEVTLDDVVEISGGGTMARPHLAKAVVRRGHVDHIQDAFDRWLYTGGPGYVKMARPSVGEAIEMIGAAGGLAVLAHPARYGEISAQLPRWKEAGLWGLEVRHPSHNTAEEARLVRLADRFGLGKTASNDWHGHQPEDRQRLGEVDFPQEWRTPFLEALPK